MEAPFVICGEFRLGSQPNPCESEEGEQELCRGVGTMPLDLMGYMAHHRGQTGVRPGSDRGQTGVRPGSDPEYGSTQGTQEVQTSTDFDSACRTRRGFRVSYGQTG